MRKVAGVAASAAASLTIVALAGMMSGCSQHEGGTAPAGKLASTDAPHPSAGAAAGAAQPGKAGAAAAAAHKTGDKTGDKPLWRNLTPAQQVALQPLQGEWDQMDGVRKQKWLQLASRFSAMKPEEQERVHARMREWVKLTPEQRELARETYNRTRKIAPEQKTATWESYQQLPDDQKKKLAASAAGRKAPSVVPSQASGKAMVQLGHGAASCPPGTVKNSVSVTPPCVAVPAPAVAPPAPQQPVPVAPPAAAPAAPAPPPEKQEPANWGITPNNA